MSNTSSGRSPAFFGIVFSICAGFCWGTFGIARGLGPAEATSISFAGLRLVIAAAALVLWAWMSGAYRAAGPVKNWPFVSTFFSGLAVGGFTYLYLEGMYRAGVSIGTPVGCASIPLFAMLVEWVMYKKRPTLTQFLGLIVVVTGITLASYAPDEQIEPGRRLSGVLFALASSLAFVYYSMALQVNTAKFPNLMVQANMFVVAAVMMFVWALLRTDCSWMLTPKGLGATLWSGLVSAVLGIWFYIKSMKVIPVSIATILSMAEPLVGAVLGIMILGESADSLKLTGLGILLFGIFVVGEATRRRSLREGSLAVIPAAAA
jgi:Predicted permeases